MSPATSRYGQVDKAMYALKLRLRTTKRIALCSILPSQLLGFFVTDPLVLLVVFLPAIAIALAGLAATAWLYVLDRKRV